MKGDGRMLLWNDQQGFTLMELIMVIVLITVLAVTAAVKFPSGLDRDGAKLELKQAVRYAQHMALTREWRGSGDSWSITVSGNKYYVGRVSAGCLSNCNSSECAEEGYCDRYLLGDSEMTLSDGQVLFNGLGEPIDISGNLAGNTTFMVAGEHAVTVCSETGYVLDGGACP